MPAKKLYSPLRYPGGKSKLTDYVIQLIRYNNLNGSTYIEPFAGGAAVALTLLIDNHVNEIYINDVDRSIYAFWYSVLNHTEELCNLITKTPINMSQWYMEKDVQLNKENEDLLALGFSTFFLNRTNRSGIIKGGVIGGLNQNGNYKIDCRFNKEDLVARIRRISEYRNRIHLHNMDIINFIDYVLPEVNGESFIFFDPPYYKKGSKLYVNYFTHDDHLELSRRISQIKDHNWIVTYDYEKEIEKMYCQFEQKTYGLKYTVQKKYTGYEIIIYSDNTLIPDDTIAI